MAHINHGTGRAPAWSLPIETKRLHEDAPIEGTWEGQKAIEFMPPPTPASMPPLALTKEHHLSHQPLPEP